MKTLGITLVAALCLASCNTTKNTVASVQETPIIITETIVKIPETPAPKEIIVEVIETPELPEIPEVIEVPTIEEIEIKELSEPEIVAPIPSFDHSAFNTILQTYVTDQGNVNYAGIKSTWSTLRNYLKALGQNMPTDAWTKNDKFAYWMNAYNAMTVDLILRNYPTASIKDIKDPWDQRLWKLGDKWYHLNEIEHQILRKMGDPRIHFGINCASFSCPPLLNEAFTADKVDSQLEALAIKFVNDSQRNTITSSRVEVSKIFTWFAKDFKTDGSLIDFLNKYSNTQISKNAKVRYRDYDWNLNK